MATTELTRSPTPSVVSPPLATRLVLPKALTDGTPRALALTWVCSRAAMMLVLGLLGGPVAGDVLYYARSLHTLFGPGTLRQTLQEYPVPVLGIMLPQYLAGAMNAVAFGFLFVTSMLAVDAAFTALLWRVSGRRIGPAVTFWLLFLPVMGPIAYFRFDLVPAALTGTALLVLVRRPAWTGALTAVGAALKLWPVAMLPAFALRRASRRSVLRGFALAGGLIGVASVAIAGYSRLISPLNWQSARGLQIESIPATPLMLLRSVHPHGTWDIRLSKYKAAEIFGFGVHGMLVISTVLTVAGVALLAWLWLRCRRDSDDLVTLGWLILAAAAVLTITNKTLSPQYILWLGGPVAALFVLSPGDPAVQRIARLLIGLSVCTQVIYPTFYNKLTTVGWYTAPLELLLAARNALLILLTGLACYEVWRRTADT